MWGKWELSVDVEMGQCPGASPAPRAAELKGRAVLFPPSRPRGLAGFDPHQHSTPLKWE